MPLSNDSVKDREYNRQVYPTPQTYYDLVDCWNFLLPTIRHLNLRLAVDKFVSILTYIQQCFIFVLFVTHRSECCLLGLYFTLFFLFLDKISKSLAIEKIMLWKETLKYSTDPADTEKIYICFFLFNTCTYFELCNKCMLC